MGNGGGGSDPGFCDMRPLRVYFFYMRFESVFTIPSSLSERFRGFVRVVWFYKVRKGLTGNGSKSNYLRNPFIYI